MSKILMVATAADSLTLADGSEHATGFWAEELVVAHRELTAAGHDVVIATPGGKPAPVDPGSLAVANVGSEEAVAELSAYLDGIAAELKAPLSLDQVNAADYAAIVLPGGHGPMTDLAFDATLGTILSEADDVGTVIAPFCHGPAGLLSASRQDGSFVFAGRKLTVFTDEEERTGGLGENTPWFVASKLRERGAVTEAGEAWSSFVVRDGNLISGQNPQSSAAVAAAVLEALQG
ncbi:thiamine biosynthesis protein ThiJ [Arthrobacter sp. SW1]|uniref:type 1 glutamine amidotransferase domain-containing protein n=1 Tax=Arthrobacter sp. SW1 TaxID=1920889 RepID=UPI000877CA75|nr:type 1 glutamine amidotransferase domain-containing protein [Arthrobacter sp. SW1]OFI37180.1 thiamine biosynthesis protein ThiJ [Arthrobacter sp. SW1]